VKTVANYVLCVRTPTKGNLSNVHSMKASKIRIYPNPAKTSVFVFSEGQGTVQIIDITGKSFLEQTIQNEVESISLKGISAGIYFVTVKIGNSSQTQKLVIE
jgi:hypothetical protein